MARKKQNYIDNKLLYEDLKVYIDEYKLALKEEREVPVLPKYTTECIMKIAQGAASRPNFSGYSYIDEMIMDGIEDCLKYLHNFDYNKYDKPFTYINRIIWQAFVRRILKEKKNQYIKNKLIYNSGISLGSDVDLDIAIKIQEFEDKEAEKKKKAEERKKLD